MNRQNRDRDENFYGRYEGYDRDDEHYHGGRNLVNEFERGYNQQGGRWEDGRNSSMTPRSYHEGNDLGDMYERRMEDSGRFRWYSDVDNENRDLVRRFSRGMDSNRDRDYDNSYTRDRDRYSNYQDDYRSYQNMDRQDQDRGRQQHGRRRQGYLMTQYDGTFGRPESLEPGSGQNRTGFERDYSGRYDSDDRNSGYGNRNYSRSGQWDDDNYSRGSRYEDRERRSGMNRNDYDRY